MSRLYRRVCPAPDCRREFITESQHKTCCSDACRLARMQERGSQLGVRPKLSGQCRRCNKAIKTSGRQFCSEDCADAWARGQEAAELLWQLRGL